MLQNANRKVQVFAPCGAGRDGASDRALRFSVSYVPLPNPKIVLYGLPNPLLSLRARISPISESFDDPDTLCISLSGTISFSTNLPL
jgi:hypothetical protein